MAAWRVGGKSFRRSYSQKTQVLLKFAEELPDRPSPDEIHDLRVTARRLQVMRGLLPKADRGTEVSRSFDAGLKSILKATSDLRDLDTLISTLSLYKETLPAEFLVKLQNQRSDAAARAKAAADTLPKVPPPDLEAAEIKGRKLSRKVRRRIRKRGRVAAELLAKVLEDESKVEELHSLRKESKKLRYLLELARGSPPELLLMTQWQECLGAIHDLDVALSFLQGNQLEFKGRAANELARNRHLNYLKFVTECKLDPMEVLADSRILPRGPMPHSW